MDITSETPVAEVTELANYGDFFRKVNFEVDGDSLTLGDGDDSPQEITESAKQAFIEQAMGWQISAKINLLRHGTFESQPASLLGIRIDFSSPGAKGWNRMAVATIQITFSPAKQGTEYPAAKIFTPFLARADVTPANVVESKKNVTSLGPEYLRIGFSRKTGKTVEYAQSFQHEVIGSHGRSREARQAKSGESDSAIWEVKEQKGQQAGISRVVQTAVVFTHDSNTVHAALKVRVRTAWGLSLLAFPWSRPHLLALSKTVAFGSLPADIEDFDDLSEEQFSDMVRLDRPFEV